MTRPLAPETEAIHAGELRDASRSHIPPIYQTSTFTFDNMAEVESYAAGGPPHHIYTRRSNPNRDALASKLSTLEGRSLIQQARANGKTDSVVAAEIFSSGMGAVSAAILGTVHAGQHLIAQHTLYGSTEHLIGEMLAQYGITVSRIDGADPDSLARELKAHPNTTAVYLETPANPTMELVDLAAMSKIARAHNAHVIVDNTFATPVLQRPLELGCDVVVHSTTKYICGHGIVVGGAVISSDVTLMDEQIAPLVRYLGAVPSPFDCWLTNLGLKTLPLRMKQHSANGMQVAQFLEAHPNVSLVHYPGLKSFPQHELAKRQMDSFGGMIAFEVKGGYDAGCRLLDKVQLCTLAVSLGNVDTLIEHPASMTHRVVPPEVRRQAGITDGLIRISVGLEAAEDIIADLEQALDAI